VSRCSAFASPWSKGLVRQRSDLGLALFLRPDTLENLVGNSHRHAAEIGHEVLTMRVASEGAFCSYC
jgi:hypothetical protein